MGVVFSVGAAETQKVREVSQAGETMRFQREARTARSPSSGVDVAALRERRWANSVLSAVTVVKSLRRTECCDFLRPEHSVL